MLKASIIINTLNRCEYLDRTLNSLRYLRYPFFEVICVNGPSVDETDKILHKWEGKIKIAKCPIANLSMSRNIGISQAAGDIICFIDDDAIPEPNWLTAIINAYDSPDIGAVGGYIRDHTGVNYQAKKIFCDFFADCFDEKQNTPQRPDTHIALTGTNCTFRRDILVKIGGFDEVFTYFLDETDVLIRIYKNNLKIKCIEGGEVYHKFAPSNMRTKDRIPKTLYAPVRSKVYYAYKHALSKYGYLTVIKKIREFINFTKSCQRYNYINNKITKELYDKLIDDIDIGYKDGLNMSFSLATPKIKPHNFFANPPEYLTFGKEYKNTLRICFISQDYLPNPNGGIGVWIGNLSKDLATRNHEITIITKTDAEPTIDFENNIWIHRINHKHFPTRPFTAPDWIPQNLYDWSASAFEELQLILGNRGIDLVCAPIWDLEGIVTLCSKQIPTALSLHTTYALALSSKNEWKNDIEYMNKHVYPTIKGEKYILEHSPMIIANSKAIVRDIEFKYKIEIQKSKIFLIPHAIPDTMSNIVVDDKSLLTILYVGRFEKRKGIHTLLNIIPDLLIKHKNIKIKLVGNNMVTDLWDNFKKRYSNENWFNRIEVPGFISDADLQKAYCECDIFVAPSRYESFGLIFLEAMSWGKPCIGTISGGIPEVVISGENGILVKPDSCEELYKAIDKLINDDRLRFKMGKCSRERFKAEFSMEKMSDRIEEAFRSFYNPIE